MSFAYPGRERCPALRDIRLRIREGEFLAVAGLNGSGKSTLCRMMNALLLPTTGRVTACGLDTSLDETLSEVRGKVALIMQNPDNQIVGPTVEDDVAFGPENLPLPREEIAQRVEDSLRALGLLELREREPYMLSEGERKRLALAGALALRPRVLVSDESTSMLDARARLDTLLLLRRLREETGLTVVHATHHADEILAADRAVLLSRGSIVFDGAPEELFEDGGRARDAGMDAPPLFALARELARLGFKVPRRPLRAEEVFDSLCL